MDLFAGLLHLYGLVHPKVVHEDSEILITFPLCENVHEVCEVYRGHGLFKNLKCFKASSSLIAQRRA